MNKDDIWAFIAIICFLAALKDKPNSLMIFGIISLAIFVFLTVSKAAL